MNIMVSFFIISIILAGVAGLVLKPGKQKAQKATKEPESQEIEKTNSYGAARFVLKRPTILTPREIECYRRLTVSLCPNFLVFPQVAFSQILDTKGGSRWQREWLRRTMSQKVADYLICKNDLTMIAVIELDDSSHLGKEEQDKMRDAVIRQIGLMPLRIPETPPQELLDRYASILSKMYPAGAATEAQSQRPGKTLRPTEKFSN
ncbi:DUF2726 domain-containing protein [Chromobacterium violaceum]|uniref:DUF2726 domain-containing protein n=1 Tax=Chromobacterium violaceum (strain ATCC 12472 / DSM 30191 / JCM 1249 / CCUG 213 / NBRC 12614 / NCIMB 9131 / NCTC 9757 / MK) TaxID=243365 RepID=Q7NVA8_CHRVO|nr:DUF2726 domain-containing protein [Chromobacterium violaceum]AAQ60107.1 hypothetical protein CV_2435 [Chromobacterium violaceum ATCC 12472]MBA8735481.1 DUF2726 domain-containing protein [Chromobacterium violaceum]SUX35635.1 Protein of uncharacterised function (DUF2726) [Chromobacterium violaceum]